ncbi:MAG: hypothetical protein AB8C95_14830 [Phycisphaeraceae bacterium]
MLETHTPSCFSSQYVLLDNGKPCGKFAGRTFSSSIDVSLLKRYRLVFKHQGIFSSRYTLLDRGTGSVIAGAAHAGLFTSAWDLSLEVGDCKMVSAGLFSQGFYIEQTRKRLAEVNVSGGCSGTWYVRPHVAMPLTDQVMIGLVFHTILRRRRQRHNSST